MKTSAVMLALFAAGAIAAPAEPSSLQAQDAALTNDAVTVVKDTTGDYPADEPVDTNEYPAKTTDYKTTDAEYPADNSSEYPEGEVKYATYEPVKQSCYKPSEKDEYQTKYGSDIYFANDEEAVKKYEEYSPVSEIYYPKQINVDEPCPISYDHKDSSYKGTYKVALCNSADKYEKCEDVCHDEESCKSYKPADSYVPSDASVGGCMYKFKVYEADAPEKCTYSKDFPIYYPAYYEKPEVKAKDCKPEPTKCPPPVYAVPAKPVAPVTPVTPVTPVEQPVAPVPVAPKPVAPVYNSTSPAAPAPVELNSGSAIRASFSAIFGIAAVVAFAL